MSKSSPGALAPEFIKTARDILAGRRQVSVVPQELPKKRGRPSMAKVPGDRYLEQRIDLGITQEGMAQRLGFGKKGVKRVRNAEHNRASPQTRRTYEKKFPALKNP